jgi:hypothetical protein
MGDSDMGVHACEGAREKGVGERERERYTGPTSNVGDLMLLLRKKYSVSFRKEGDLGRHDKERCCIYTLFTKQER